jgi:hypothetical protein
MDAVEFPLKHRAVVTTVIKLTNGARGMKVRMSALITALRSEYGGAREDFLFSLALKAEEDGVLKREIDREGCVWASLITTFAPEVSDPVSKNYPAAHRAVVSVIQDLVGGDFSREVPIDRVHEELRRKGYAGTVQASVNMTMAATNAHVMRIQRKNNGETYALLEDPKLSSPSDPRGTSKSNPVPSGIKQSSPGYVVRNVPLSSLEWSLTESFKARELSTHAQASCIGNTDTHKWSMSRPREGGDSNQGADDGRIPKLSGRRPGDFTHFRSRGCESSQMWKG